MIQKNNETSSPPCESRQEDKKTLLPVVAIVGRPNVGKSTLFNRLTKTRNAVISASPGTTRDRQYGMVTSFQQPFIIVDTGGLLDDQDPMESHVTKQVYLALDEADKVIFLLDARQHLTADDKELAQFLRERGKHIYLVLNKCDGVHVDDIIHEAYELGLGEPHPISSSHGTGVVDLIDAIFPEKAIAEVEAPEEAGIKIAIVGRPNVGKSTLTNRMLGEERVIVHDAPGTTRDSIYIPLKRLSESYILIDTAGVRKRKKVDGLPEKFSIIKTLQSIENAHVVLYVIDARIGVSEQDLKLLSFILECGKGLVIAVNKWDNMEDDERDLTRASLDRQLDFVEFARQHFISALHGSGVGNLFDSILEAYHSATKKLSTPVLSRLLEQALVTHSPPLVHGKRIKLRYAHTGGSNPPTIVIHGTRLEQVPESYKKFLARFFQKKLNLKGTAIKLVFKNTDNPYI